MMILLFHIFIHNFMFSVHLILEKAHYPTTSLLVTVTLWGVNKRRIHANNLNTKSPELFYVIQKLTQGTLQSIKLLFLTR